MLNGEPERWEDDEGADERYGNSQQGDKSGTPALKEDEDNDDDQGESLDQGQNDFVDACGDGQGGVERDVIGNACGEAGGELLHAGLDSSSGCDRVRARQLIDSHDARRGLIVAGRDGVRLLTQLNAGDVAEVNDGAVRVGANDNGAELFWLDEAALGAHGVGELLALRYGFRAYLSGWVHIVLGLDSLDDVGRCNAELGHLVRVDQTRSAY